uniref:Succinate dehydrogenase assembly factor 4, mitochondrial n=1 Tax=Steinernema glaseri TaxID=37863 RepID=A0A1I7Y6X6_9BILA
MISCLSRLARSPIAAAFRLKSTDPTVLPVIGEGQVPATSAKEHPAPILLETKKRILANLPVDKLPDISEECAKTLSERLVKRHGEGALPALRYVLKDVESSYSDRCFNFRDLPSNLKLIASQLRRNERTLPRKPIEQVL